MQPPKPSSEVEENNDDTPKHVAPDFAFNSNRKPANSINPKNAVNKSLTPLPMQSGGDDENEVAHDDPPNKTSQISFKAFLNKQNEFIKEKQKDIKFVSQTLKESEDKSLKQMPTINSYSKALASKIDLQIPTYERLSKRTKNKIDNIQISPSSEIPKAHGAPKCYYNTKKQKQVPTYKPKAKACPLKNTKDTLISKFKKEFNDCVSISSKSERVNINEFEDILAQLHIINASRIDKEKQDLWQLLNVNNQGYANVNDIFTVLCAILFRYELPDNTLGIDKTQAAQLHSKFLSFSLNRMNQVKPKMMQQADNLQTKNIKIPNGKHDLNSFLQRQKTLLNSITERNNYKDNRDLVGCTFAPKIIKRNRNNSMENKKYIEQLAKQSKKDLGRSTNEIEFERQFNDLRFSPLINKGIIKPSNKVEIRGANNIVQRLRTSYIEKNKTKKQLTYREYNTHQQDKANSIKSEEPCIYIDVNMGNREERISIYEGDNPEKVALQFARAHSILMI